MPSTKSHRAAVISGGPGTGKSRLAAEYVHKRGGKGFWTDAGTSVSETLAALAPSLGVESGTRSSEEIAVEVEQALAGELPETLWVIDNLTDLSLVNDLLGRTGPVQLLVTTRDAGKQVLPGTVSFIQLESLEQAAAVKLLISRSKYRTTNKVLKEIANRVGYLPLALEMLAVRLGEPRQTSKKLLDEFQNAATAIDVAAFQEAAGATIPRADGVYAAIVGSLEALPREIRRQIAALGYLADAPIPEALILTITGTDEDALAQLLQECGRYSILAIRDSDIVVHALTAAAIAATNEGGALEAVVKRADMRLAEIVLDDPVSLRAESTHYERLRERAVAVVGTEEPLILQFAHSLAVGYFKLGRYKKTVALSKETLRGQERALGADDPSTLYSRTSMAAGLQALGRHQEAAALSEKALPVYERVFGPEHPDTLMARSNVATSYWAMGRSEEAVALDEEVLAMRERVLGPEHPHTLKSRDSVAMDYRALGRNEDAVALVEETLAARGRVLGLDHPDTLESRNNLANAYSALGRHSEAVALDEETLANSQADPGP